MKFENLCEESVDYDALKSNYISLLDNFFQIVEETKKVKRQLKDALTAIEIVDAHTRAEIARHNRFAKRLIEEPKEVGATN